MNNPPIQIKQIPNLRREQTCLRGYKTSCTELTAYMLGRVAPPHCCADCARAEGENAQGIKVFELSRRPDNHLLHVPKPHPSQNNSTRPVELRQKESRGGAPSQRKRGNRISRQHDTHSHITSRQTKATYPRRQGVRH